MKQANASIMGPSVFGDEPSAWRDPAIWVLAALSLVAHLVLVPAILGIARSDSSLSAFNATNAPMPLEPERPKVRAGIEESQRSTLTWLGFAEPEPHEARLDTIEQSALSPSPVNAPPSPVSQPLAGEPAATETERAPEPALTQAATRSVTEGISEAIDLAANLSEQALIAVARARLAASQRPAAPDQSEPVDEPADPVADRVAQADLPMPTDEPAGVDPDAEGQDEKPKAGQPTAREAAVESPKDSLATSTIKPVRVRPGRPAAAEGLDITTVRPKWPYVTRLSALPRDPVIAVEFGKDGRVARAVFVVGKSTGDDRVDGPLLDAMYNWTAKGKALDDLPTGGTLRMTFAIDLGAR